MNTATRAAVRLGLDEGHQVLGIHGGFRGLIDGDVEELGWMSVRGWTTAGGCELGINRTIPRGKDFYTIARNIEDLKIDGILMVGGWSGYDASLRLARKREAFPAFEIPIICLPATINNNLPGVGAFSRFRYRPECHCRSCGQNQTVCGGLAALLCGRGDGQVLRISRPHGRHRERR